MRFVDPTTKGTTERGTGRCLLPFVLPTEHILCNDSPLYIAYVLERDSSVARDLLHEARRVFGSNLRFLSDGYVTFVTPEGALQVAPFDPETLQIGRPATLPQRLRRDGTSGAAQYAVTSDGTLVYAPGENAEVGRLVRYSRGEWDYLPVEAAPFLTFDLSPNGDRLAAVVVAIAGLELWVYDLPTNRSRQWLSSEFLQEPRWSPSGEKLAVSAMLETLGTQVILVGDPDSGPPSDTVISTASPSDFFSEDSLLASGGRSRNMVMVDLSRGQPTVDVLSEVQMGMPAISPDGQWLAYMPPRDLAGRYEVYLEPYPEGGQPRTVPAEGGQEPVWLSDTELAYRRGHSWYTVSVGDDGPSDPQLWFTDDRFRDTPGRSHAPSRDGGVIYVQGTSRSTASFLRVIPDWAEGAMRAADEANR